MIAVVQRASEAKVEVAGEVVGRIGVGLLALVSIHATDDADEVGWMAGKLVSLRLFRNGEKHFDRDVREVGGSILLVSNFTVAAKTRQGRRPSFDAAADPATGRRWFDELANAIRTAGVPVETGRFGADMAVSLVNDGPATFIVDRSEKSD